MYLKYKKSMIYNGFIMVFIIIAEPKRDVNADKCAVNAGRIKLFPKIVANCYQR